MNLKRWDLIQDLFHEAVACDATARTELLRQRCQDDHTLIAEIQSLLCCHDAPRQLWEHGRLALGMKLLVFDEELQIDKDFGNYTLERIIGRGGMGEVYLGCDNRLGRHVALKFLPRSLSSDPEWSLRFHEEACAASSIAHPNVAHIYELGNTNNRQYIAMEFIDGVTLRERLKLGPIDLSESVEICEQVGRGIAAAHAVGVLHRDIKPENIMLAADGFVKVLDFGLAKTSKKVAPYNHQHGLESRLTSPGVIMGTAAYMSPEHLCGEDTDSRSDIWSLGVTLYEMISGHQPFRGQTYGELRNAVLFTEPVPLPMLNEDDSTITLAREILSRALERNREYRYGSIEEFVKDLKRLKLILRQNYTASTPEKDLTTAGYPYPPAPAFQRTSEFVNVGPDHAHRKERLLTMSIFLVTSFGFLGVLLATGHSQRLLYTSLDIRPSNLARLMYLFIGITTNVLGGFAVGSVGTLIKTPRRVRYLFVMVSLVVGYVLFFLTFTWLPSLGVLVFTGYSLPYFGAALMGASVAFRPWSLLRLISIQKIFKIHRLNRTSQ